MDLLIWLNMNQFDTWDDLSQGDPGDPMFFPHFMTILCDFCICMASDCSDGPIKLGNCVATCSDYRSRKMQPSHSFRGWSEAAPSAFPSVHLQISTWEPFQETSDQITSFYAAPIGGFHKQGFPQIIHLQRNSHEINTNKLSNFGCPHVETSNFCLVAL